MSNDEIKEKLFRHRKINEKTGCWLWTKGRFDYGYGCIWIDGKSKVVSRIAYEVFIGPLKNFALHKQICPYRHCFNPDHLYDGEQVDNIWDMMELGTHNSNKTHCPQGHEFTIKNTGWWGRNRYCKTCKHERYIIRRDTT